MALKFERIVSSDRARRCSDVEFGEQPTPRLAQRPDHPCITSCLFPIARRPRFDLMERILYMVSGVSGFLAVALGAFGAHGLERRLSSLPDYADRMRWWTTGAHYHLVHAVAIAAAGAAIGLPTGSRPRADVTAGS